MKNIFSPYTTQINFSSFEEDGINHRISLIKEFYRNNVDWDLFERVLSNLHNQNGIESLATKYPRKNCFHLEDWSKHFASNGVEYGEEIIISSTQLKLLFSYLREYHPNIIVRVQDDIYRHDSIPSGDDFRIEYLILRSLEIE